MKSCVEWLKPGARLKIKKLCKNAYASRRHFFALYLYKKGFDIMATTITAPATADINTAVQLGVETTVKGKILNVGVGEFLNITKNLPYEFTTNYADATTLVRAVSLDESSNVIISEQNANWLYDSNGELLFDSNSLLLEGA